MLRRGGRDRWQKPICFHPGYIFVPVLGERKEGCMVTAVKVLSVPDGVRHLRTIGKIKIKPITGGRGGKRQPVRGGGHMFNIATTLIV